MSVVHGNKQKALWGLIFKVLHPNSSWKSGVSGYGAPAMDVQKLVYVWALACSSLGFKKSAGLHFSDRL